jgi:hypothetical protein
MILDSQALFSDDQAITATAISTNVLDLGVPGTPRKGNALVRDVGPGNPLTLLCQVTETFDACTSIAITVEVSAAAALTSSKVLSSQTILLADLVRGKQLNIQAIPNDADLRYLGIRYTVAGSAPTVGKFTAGISAGNDTNNNTYK